MKKCSECFIDMVYTMRMGKYIVKVFWDEEASAWLGVCDEIPLALHGDTIELLMEDVKETAPEVMELNGIPVAGQTLSFQIEERLTPAV